jgi:hypothetical protein
MTSLFQPLNFKSGAVLKNRFMLAPLTNTQSHADGRLSDDEYHWLTTRAKTAQQNRDQNRQNRDTHISKTATTQNRDTHISTQRYHNRDTQIPKPRHPHLQNCHDTKNKTATPTSPQKQNRDTHISTHKTATPTSHPISYKNQRSFALLTEQGPVYTTKPRHPHLSQNRDTHISTTKPRHPHLHHTKPRHPHLIRYPTKTSVVLPY